MPRYYLHVRNGDDLAPDLEGQDFEDLVAARHEALISAQELWRTLEPNIARDRVSIEIMDDSGGLLGTVALSDVGRKLAQGFQ